MATRNYRAVVVRRPTDYESLISTHATRGQAEFFLQSRSQSIEEIEQEHSIVQSAIATVLAGIPSRWRRAGIDRSELSRFLFEPDDVVITVGQDGLVANVAKYLSGQLAVGVNPLPQRFDGVLVRHPAAAASDLLADIDANRPVAVQSRAMVRARLDDGQSLTALNEIFIGHRSHQSARYRIALGDRVERQSSSGIICCTGTGATGWASSIHRATASPLALPGPTEAKLCFFVREAWPSKFTMTGLSSGTLQADNQLVVTSELNQGGVVFGDGIEDDYLPFDWGRVASVGIDEQRLRLVA
ncbi:MAG: hypothetical protein JNK16_08085 [Phycisphaerales bacterium]|nr:hypothetical protein [Phycisphaerales bacterium]